MRRDTLHALARLRDRAVEDSRRELARCIAAEAEAQARLDDTERRLLIQGEAAADLAAGDEVVEAYARWLPIGREEIVQARRALDAATAEVHYARATLDAARAAARLVSDALERERRDETVRSQKQEQAEIDEQAIRAERNPF